MPETGGIFKRNKALIFFLIGLIVVFALLYTLRSAIFPFIIGIVLVYLLLPLIMRAEKRLPYKGKWTEVKRIFLVLLAIIAVPAVVGLFIFYLFGIVADSLSVLINAAPEFIAEGLTTLQEWFESFRQNLSLDLLPGHWQKACINWQPRWR